MAKNSSVTGDGVIGGEVQDNGDHAGKKASEPRLKAFKAGRGGGVVNNGVIAGDVQNSSGSGNTQSIRRR